MTDFSAQQGSELRLKLKRLGVISTAFQQSAIAFSASPRRNVPRGTFERTQSARLAVSQAVFHVEHFELALLEARLIS
jgi:hypothetical protein